MCLQLGHDDIVIDMANGLLENWEYRKVYKADLILALAVAYCNKARELLKEEQVGHPQRLDPQLELQAGTATAAAGA